MKQPHRNGLSLKPGFILMLTLVLSGGQVLRGVQNGDFMDCVLQANSKKIRPKPGEAWLAGGSAGGTYELVRLNSYNPEWFALFQDKLQGVRIEHSIRQEQISVPKGKIKLQFYASTVGREGERQLLVVWREGGEIIKQVEMGVGHVPAVYEVQVVAGGRDFSVEFGYARQGAGLGLGIVVTGVHVHKGEGLLESLSRQDSDPVARTAGVQDPLFQDNLIRAFNDKIYIPPGEHQITWRSSQSICIVRLESYNADWRLKLRRAIQGVRMDDNHQTVQQSQIFIPVAKTYYLSFYLSTVTDSLRREAGRTKRAVMEVEWNGGLVGRCGVTGEVSACWMYIAGRFGAQNSIGFRWRAVGGERDARLSQQIVVTNVQVIGDRGMVVYKILRRLAPVAMYHPPSPHGEVPGHGLGLGHGQHTGPPVFPLATGRTAAASRAAAASRTAPTGLSPVEQNPYSTIQSPPVRAYPTDPLAFHSSNQPPALPPLNRGLVPLGRRGDGFFLPRGFSLPRMPFNGQRLSAEGASHSHSHSLPRIVPELPSHGHQSHRLLSNPSRLQVPQTDKNRRTSHSPQPAPRHPLHTQKRSTSMGFLSHRDGGIAELSVAVPLRVAIRGPPTRRPPPLPQKNPHPQPTPAIARTHYGFSDPLCSYFKLKTKEHFRKVPCQQQKYWLSERELTIVRLIRYNKDWQHVRQKFHSRATQGMLLDHSTISVRQEEIATKRLGFYRVGVLVSLMRTEESIKEHQQGVKTMLDVFVLGSAEVSFSCQVHMDVSMCAREVQIQRRTENGFKFAWNRQNAKSKASSIIVTGFRLKMVGSLMPDPSSEGSQGSSSSQASVYGSGTREEGRKGTRDEGRKGTRENDRLAEEAAVVANAWAAAAAQGVPAVVRTNAEVQALADPFAFSVQMPVQMPFQTPFQMPVQIPFETPPQILSRGQTPTRPTAPSPPAPFRRPKLNRSAGNHRSIDEITDDDEIYDDNVFSSVITIPAGVVPLFQPGEKSPNMSPNKSPKKSPPKTPGSAQSTQFTFTPPKTPVPFPPTPTPAARAPKTPSSASTQISDFLSKAFKKMDHRGNKAFEKKQAAAAPDEPYLTVNPMSPVTAPATVPVPTPVHISPEAAFAAAYRQKAMNRAASEGEHASEEQRLHEQELKLAKSNAHANAAEAARAASVAHAQAAAAYAIAAAAFAKSEAAHEAAAEAAAMKIVEAEEGEGRRAEWLRSLEESKAGSQVYEALTGYFRGYSMELRPVVSDGDCLYRAVALSVLGDQGKWEQVKKKAMHELGRNTAKYSREIVAGVGGGVGIAPAPGLGLGPSTGLSPSQEQQVRKYLKRVRQPGVYGSQIELRALSRAYGSTFLVHQMDCRLGVNGKISGRVEVGAVRESSVPFDLNKMVHLVVQFHGSPADHWQSAGAANGQEISKINAEHFSGYFKAG